MKAFGNIEKDSQVRAVASGAISSGKPVVVNSDGTVSVVNETSSSETLGSDVTFNAASTSYVANAFDSTNNKVVVAYRDGGNSGFGHARVGTVDSSDNSISFGTEVTFRSSETQYISACFDSANGKIVIAYQDQGDSFKGKAIVGTVSGTDISFGSSVEFQTGETKWINAVYDTSTSKVVIVYQDSSNNGKAIVGTVSGTSISFGSAVSTGHGATQGTAVYHAAASRIVAAGKVNNSTANAVVGAVSGTSISFGSAVAYGTSSAQKNNNKLAYDSASEKVVVFYRDEGSSNYGRASVGTVDASDNSISFASGVTVTTDTVDQVGVQGFSSGGQIIFVYSDTSNTKGDLKVGTISGTTLSVGSELNVRDGGNVGYWGLCEDTTNDRIVIAYDGASSNGISNVYNPAFSVSNITSENYIGMSPGFVSQSTISQSAGTPVTFNSGSPRVTNIAYDTNSNRIVIVYRDDGNSGHGTAIVGTVSGTSISFGTEVVFNAAETKFPAISYDTNAQKVLITYQDEGNSNYGTAIVGTVDSSDNSISFGSETVFKSAATSSQASVYDPDSQKVIIAFSGGGQQPSAAVATISGTSVSFGSLANFAGTNDAGLAMAYDTDTNKVVIAYRDGSDVQGKSVVGTVSGTSISFGSEVVYESSGVDSFLDIAYDASAQKIVIAFLATGDVGKAIVGTVSGTSISYGTAVTYDTVASDHNAIAYDPTAESVAIFYRDTTPFHGKAVSGKVSGTSITFTDQITFQSGRAERMAAVYDPDSEKVIVAYHDYAASTGDAVVFTTGFISTTRGQIADGGKAVIDSTNTISRNQLGLTAGQTYFVQTDGTLSETADSPSVTAGTAISATELIVKG